MRPSTRTTLGLAAAVTATAALSPDAHANVTGWYSNNQNMLWNVSGMPDFDQSRTSAPGILGLANGGSVHCVPTSSMNMFAYAAAHGYPDLAPGVQSWNNGNLQTYNAATLNIALLGLGMNTAPPGGTGNTGWYNGARSWLPEGQFNVWHQIAFNGQPVNTREIAKLGLNGALVSFCYGRWNHDGFTLTSRSSGHCVTPVRVEVDDQLFGSELKYRDPASGGSAFSQSTFSTATADMTDLFWTYQGSPYLLSTFDVGNTLSSGKYNIIDTIHAIFPKQGLTDWPAGQFTLYTPTVFDHRFRTQTTFDAPGPIKLLQQSPNRLSIALVSAVPDIRRYCLYAIDPLIGEPVPVATINNPKAMEFDRRGYLNILDGNVVKQFDLNNAEQPLIGSFEIPDGAIGDDLCCNDATDEIVVVSSNPRQMHRFPFDFSSDPISDSIPYIGPYEGREMMATINPADGTLFVGYRGAGEIVQLRRDPTNGRLVRGVGYGGPDALPIDSFSMDDRGHALLVIEGRITELMFSAAAGPQVVEGPFSGREAGPNFQISRDRTNFDPETQDEPGWDIATPLDQLRIAEEIPDCAADYDQNGIADIGDLLDFLADWFIADPRADLNEDGESNIGDLLDFLTAWFAGC